MRLNYICGEAIRKLWIGRWRLRGYVPFTNWNIVWRNLDKKAKSILDIGCGKGRPMRFINRHGCFFTVGVDGFEPYLDQCQRENSHSAFVLGDARALPFKEKSFDIVLCLQVLEHFDREEGSLLLNQMDRITKRQVLVTTDVGKCVQSQAIDGNPLQVHKYVWSINELKELDYKVFGIGGLLGWGGETGISRLLPTPFRWFINTVLQLLAGPILYFFPRYAGSALCVKNVSRWKLC